ncbi:MAG: DoxX family protein [Bacteroidaceae bacterium]|nr:DoxX family protein [Bacteroidaceae bacterium]
MVLQSKSKRHFIVLVNACRWVLALVLMLSGFLKAVDPVGGMYKLQEYAVAFSFSGISEEWLLMAAVMQAAVEFLAGLYLFLGVYRTIVSFAALLMMLVFTPFSLYLWRTGIVSDCGCFGESMILSNGATFAKNVFLLLFASIAFLGRSLFVGNLSHRTRWMLVLFSWVYIFGLQTMSLSHLPLIDFGPYAVGSDLRSKVAYIPDEYESKAVYYNKETGNGEPFVVDVDTVMGDEWELGAYTEVLTAPGTEPEIGNFSILDWDRDIEFADELLADTGYVCIVVIDNVETASVTHIDKINDLYDYCEENGIRFCAASSSYGDEVLLWTKRTGAEYPLYWGGQAMLRSMLHSNPGLLLLKDGVVVGKWAAADIPVMDELNDLGVLMSDTEWSFLGTVKGWPFWVTMFSGVLFLLLLLDVLLWVLGLWKHRRAARGRAAEQVVDNETSDMN